MADLMGALMVSAPVQVFGLEYDEAKRRYKELAKKCHPDTGGTDNLFQRLESLWSDHNAGLDDWMLGAGDIADVSTTDSGVVMKTLRNDALYDMLEHEYEVLQKLQYMNQRTDAFYPLPVTLDESSMMYTYTEASPYNLYTLASITEYYNGDVPDRHIGWIWRKLLVAMDYAHSLGIIHSAITPDNILIQPYSHGLVLIDWIHASINQEPVSSISVKNESFYPPEKYDKDPPTPGWDTFMAAGCMMEACPSMSSPMEYYFNTVAAANFRARVSDFRELKDSFDRVIFDQLGWKREFVIMDFPDWEQL